jgi:hypothetical protein
MPKIKKEKLIRNRFSKKETMAGIDFSLSGDFGQYIDLGQASVETGLRLNELTALIDGNRIRAVRLGQKLVIKKYWIEDYIDRFNGSGYPETSIEPTKTTDCNLRKKSIVQPGDEARCDSGQGDFYLWTSAMLFLLFFFTFVPKGDFRMNGLDIGRSAEAVKDVSDLSGLEGAADGRSENGLMADFSAALGSIYVAPALEEENFTPLWGQIESLFDAAYRELKDRVNGIRYGLSG